MGPFIEDGKFKVLEVLQELEGYTACLCIDVETNNHYRPMVFNIYEKEEDIRRYLPAFFNLNKEQFTDFIRVVSGKHCIFAIFAYHEGVKLRDFFKDGKTPEFEKRVAYATRLFQECLILDAMPDLISLPCLEPDHMVVIEQANRVRINYVIPPLAPRRKAKGEQCAALLECIFKQDRYVPEGLGEFIAHLRLHEQVSIVSAFSQWKELAPGLLTEHQNLLKETWWAYGLRRLKQLWQRKKRRLR
ncbi:hypothetical protein [Desulfitobacterium hafniense]|uniref:hypothetical protein n=1 Tax=Desulfitobacterium hafniense TaxID=49338 RepID=UPI0003680DAF|nr:hypothetical protein [Desulfitobacterium hafniense]